MRSNTREVPEKNEVPEKVESVSYTSFPTSSSSLHWAFIFKAVPTI